MLEVAEASRVITESVNKDAKIIYGIYNDDTLKKDEVKVTVIATGFPTSTGARRGESNRVESINTSMSPSIQDNRNPNNLRDFIKHTDRQDRSEDKIDNTVSTVDNKKKDKDKDEEFVEDKKPKFVFNNEEEEEDWGALPPFLMRKKK